MDLKSIYIRINFAERYRNLCDAHNDFDNGLRGNKKDLYDQVLEKFGYKIKYNSREKFYRIVSSASDYHVGLQLTLKDGLVEPMIDIKKDEAYLTPDGRFDFIPEDMGVPFERKKYNLPIYTSQKELEEILKEIFLIYEDIKKELESLT